MTTSSPLVERVDDHAVVALAGEVDLMVRSDLIASYNCAISLLGVPHLPLDVSQVTFVDSTGCDTLGGAWNTVNARGGTISVAGAGARIVKLLRLTHVDGLVTLLPEAEPEAKVVAVAVA
jgi:anti-sigma B factor antagonist